MSVLSSKALHEQLSVIMGALTKAAVAEICEVVDEGYAVLQMEISRSHKENDDLRKKLHLIESIVVRGSCGGKKAEPGVVVAATEGAKQAGTQQQQQRGDDGGDTAAAGGGDGGAAVFLREELPDVVLIKDEDSDSNDTFEGEGDKAPADRATAAARESATSSPTGRSMKRPWPGNEDAERKSSSELTLISPTTSKQTQKKSVSVYSLDSPRSEPGCSAQLGGDEMEAGGELVCSYSSQMDPDIHLVHQECSLVPPMSSASRQVYYANSTLIDSQSQSTDGAELDLTPTWSKQSKSHMAFAQFHQNENMDGDAFGLKLINVSGSTPTDCQLSESSNSAFGYDEADTMNFAVYRDQSGYKKQKLASIMEVLANTAVAEICELVDGGYAVLQLEISRSRKENEALRRKLRLMELRAARATALRAVATASGTALLLASGRARAPLPAHHPGNEPRRSRTPGGGAALSRVSPQETPRCRDIDPSSDSRHETTQQAQPAAGESAKLTTAVIKVEDDDESWSQSEQESEYSYTQSCNDNQ
eukprot:superscaffoldBa00007577_g22660